MKLHCPHCRAQLRAAYRMDELSPMQQRIAGLWVTTELSCTEIANELNLSETHVSTILARIYAALGIGGRSARWQLALRLLGLVESREASRR